MTRETSEHEEVPSASLERKRDASTDDGWGDDDSRTGGSRAQVQLDQPESQLDESHLEPERPRPSDPDDGWGEDFVARPEPRKSLSNARQAVERAYDDEPAPPPDDKPPDPTASDQQGEHRTIGDAIGRSEANEARTLDAAKDYAEGLGIEYVDFRGFDQPTANETNATLEALLEKYPDIPGLRTLSTIQSRNAELASLGHDMPHVSGDTIAETGSSRLGAFAGIVINESWASHHDVARAELERQEHEHSHPPGLNSMHGVVAHEFGHLVYNDIRQAGDGEPVLDALRAVFSDDAVAAIVSVYAKKSESECFAEAFAEYHLSAKPRDAARSIGRAIDDYYSSRV